MINFFRKIRMQFISDRKFNKYLVYALGEIILVVIGILIALQINNWNNRRIDQIQERELLTNILEDLKTDQQIISDLVQNAIIKQETHIRIYKETIASTFSPDFKPLSGNILEISNLISKTFDNHQGSIDRITNIEIRNNLNTYFSTYQTALKQTSILNDAILNELRKFTREKEILNFKTVFESSPNKDDIDEFEIYNSKNLYKSFGTKEFNSIVLELFLATQDAIQSLESLLNNNRTLQSSLEDFINSRS